MFSRWYSAKMANELKRQHEEKNNFKYDFVMLTRLDLAYLVDFDFSKFLEITKITSKYHILLLKRFRT